MYALWLALKLKIRTVAKRLLSQLFKLFKYVIKHPAKTVLFTVKLYISFILFGFFLMASFSSFAEQIPAEPTRGQVYSPSWFRDYDTGQDVTSLLCTAMMGARGYQSCNAEVTSSIGITNYSLRYTYVDSSGNQQPARTETVNFHAGTGDARCPPNGYPQHTVEVMVGDTLYCDTNSNTDPEPPYVEQVPLDCISRAGNQTEAYYSLSETQLTAEERSELNCMTFMDNKGNLYNERCHVTGASGNTIENQDPDSGLWQYTIIGGNFSGYQCNEAGVPIAEDKYCTALSNEGVHSVRCPDGSSMSIDMNPYDAYNEAFSAFRSSAQNDINTLYNSISTAEEVASEILNNPEYKEAVTGQGCHAALIEGGAQITCGDGNAQTIFHGNAGAKGADGTNGINGTDGVDGESCQTIQDGRNVRIICPESVAVVQSGTDGTNGVDGVDGEGCEVIDLGNGDSEIVCASSRSTVNGIDEDGVIAAIEELGEDLTYDGSVTSGGFGTGAVATFVGEANNYEERNYGTVLTAAVTRMKESPLVESVDTFFDVSITGTCPTYSADITFMQTNVLFDHWCRPVMDSIWPMVQGVIILLFSIIGFRAAIL